MKVENILIANFALLIFAFCNDFLRETDTDHDR
jgi:hypothetical protein